VTVRIRVRTQVRVSTHLLEDGGEHGGAEGVAEPRGSWRLAVRRVAREHRAQRRNERRDGGGGGRAVRLRRRSDGGGGEEWEVYGAVVAAGDLVEREGIRHETEHTCQIKNVAGCEGTAEATEHACQRWQGMGRVTWHAVRCGALWCGAMWYGVVWCCVVSCGGVGGMRTVQEDNRCRLVGCAPFAHWRAIPIRHRSGSRRRRLWRGVAFMSEDVTHRGSRMKDAVGGEEGLVTLDVEQLEAKGREQPANRFVQHLCSVNVRYE
jgi:hypothetical protein